jgi:hypothetical protein
VSAATAVLKHAPGVQQLDVRNVLWLLAAMVFVVGPHLLRLPNWLGFFFIGVVAWRAWIPPSAGWNSRQGEYSRARSRC